MIFYSIVSKESFGNVGDYGAYVNRGLAQSVLDEIVNNGLKFNNIKIMLDIVEIEVLDKKPAIYSHIAKLKFEDINDVDVTSLSYSKVLDNIKDIKLNEVTNELGIKNMGLSAYGVNEKDALQNVKQKMVTAIQNGTYGFWKESMRINGYEYK